MMRGSTLQAFTRFRSFFPVSAQRTLYFVLSAPNFLDKHANQVIYFNKKKAFFVLQVPVCLTALGGVASMTPEAVIDVGRDALLVTLLIAAPPLLAGLAVGLLISIFQAVTQIQEFTLTFIPKILAVFLATIIFLPWMLRVFLGFTTNLFIQIPMFGK